MKGGRVPRFGATQWTRTGWQKTMFPRLARQFGHAKGHAFGRRGVKAAGWAPVRIFAVIGGPWGQAVRLGREA